MIYLDYAATYPMTQQAIDAYAKAAALPGNPASIHVAGQAAREYLEEGRMQVAKVLGIDARLLTINSGGTEGNNHVIQGIARQYLEQHGRPGHLISTPTEHSAVLAPIRWLEQQGWAVSWLTPDRHGLYQVAELEENVRNDTALISIHHINNELGTIQDTPNLAAVAANRGIPYHCDAVQAPGLFVLPLEDWGVTFATISAHKWGGPRGVGFLYVKRGQELAAITLGGGQEGGLRPGTQDTAGVYAAGVSFTEAEAQRTQNLEYIQQIRQQFLNEVAAIPQVICNHPTNGSPKIANLTFEGADGEALLMNLDMMGISASAGSACSAGTMQPSHVLTAVGLSESNARASLRFSFGAATKSEEITAAVQAITQAVQFSRG